MQSHPKAVIDFCKARQALRDEEARRKDTLEETADAKRVSMDLLMESMTKHRVECVCLPPTTVEGEIKYARIVPGNVKYSTFRSVDDVARFAHDMYASVKDTPEVDVPREVLRTFLERAKREEPMPRLTICPKVPQKVAATLPSQPATEVTRLSSNVASAVQEYRSCREPIKALKSTTREAEKVVQKIVREEEPVLLQMERNGQRRLVNVTKQPRKTSASKPRGIGVRKISSMVQEAARFAVHERQEFDARFVQRLRMLVQQELDDSSTPQTSSCTIRVRERRIPTAATTTSSVVLVP